MTNEESQAANKAAQEKIDARVKELKELTGKWFVSKTGGVHKIKVLGYAGIASIGPNQAHVINVEIPSHARWTPVASKFLDEHYEVEAPKTETDSKEII